MVICGMREELGIYYIMFLIVNIYYNLVIIVLKKLNKWNLFFMYFKI